jgi:predicted site-specific integrase-resolvase
MTGHAWLSVEDAAHVAGVSRQALYGWIERGRVRIVLTEEGYRVAARDVTRECALRRTAAQVGISQRTLRQWLASTDEDAAGAGPGA